MDISSWHIDPAWVYYPAAVLLQVFCAGSRLLSLLTLPGNWIVVALAAGELFEFAANLTAGPRQIHRAGPIFLFS